MKFGSETVDANETFGYHQNEQFEISVFKFCKQKKDIISIVISTLSCSCSLQMEMMHVCLEGGKGCIHANRLSCHRFDKHRSHHWRWCDSQSTKVYFIRFHVQRSHPAVTLDREDSRFGIVQMTQLKPFLGSHSCLDTCPCMMSQTSSRWKFIPMGPIIVALW